MAPQLPVELSGRFQITDVFPSVLGGRRPAAAAVGEAVPIFATAFREGHDALGVDVILSFGNQHTERIRMASAPGVDRWSATVRPDAIGDWTFTIEAWSDPWHTWTHRARVKVAAGIDVEVELEEGAQLLDRAPGKNAATKAAAKSMRSTSLPLQVRLAAGLDPEIDAVMTTIPIREMVTSSGPWPLRVQRRRALVGAWYEFFPRSEGAIGTSSGTFATAARRLDSIAAMGFDVVYLPPVHPIGDAFRKGRNNALRAEPDDVGSPWAIGSKDGGHDAIHPDLGTLADFDAFVARATELDLEIALDLALQASPDHPWVSAHPEWFTTRADGTIAYAENPPKKYQDIYPLNFDNDPDGLFAEVERIVRFWMDHGVRIFRVDNPHTKPLWVWERLIENIRKTDPDVLFLAEAFTKPTMMRALADIGFQQSYTYFTWRTGSSELRDYLYELAGPLSASMRPNFFTNTPDILHEFLQHGGSPAFTIRATLAATMSPSYGIYSGFELFEHVAVAPGSEEYLDSEKYQLRPRDWQTATETGDTLAPYLTMLNRVRRNHPALQDLRSIHFHYSENPDVIAFSKRDGDDLILVAITLDPHSVKEATIWWDMDTIGLAEDELFVAHDYVTDQSWTWGHNTYVRFEPWDCVAHVVHVRRP